MPDAPEKTQGFKLFIWEKLAALLAPLIKPGFDLHRASREFRSRIWNSKETGLLLSTDGPETYVVSAADHIIGQIVYLDHSFDFDKFLEAMDTLGKSTQPFTLVDIGANIGTICIPAVKRGIAQAAIAIEPEPFNLKLLRANVALNDLHDQIDIHGYALGSEDGTLTFELSPVNFGDHRIRLDVDAGKPLMDEDQRKTISVPVRRLDDILQDQTGNLVLWMDVQGFESYVLQGAPRTLSQGHPLIMEFSPYEMKRVKGDTLLKEVLTKSCYSHFIDLQDPELTRRPLTGEALDAVTAQLDTFALTDLLMIADG